MLNQPSVMGGKLRHNKDSQRSKKQGKTFTNDYNGYYPDTDQLDIVKLSQLNPDEFYANYVKRRRPVIIDGKVEGFDIDEFQPHNIVSKLHTEDQTLLVEKKFQGGFGSGTERIKMTFEDFMERLGGEDGDQYYLTTQYAEDDPDEISKALEGLDGDSTSDSEDEEAAIGSVTDGGEDDDDDDDDNDEEEEDEQLGKEGDAQFVPTMAMGDAFSDTDSIDFNNIHDDFDDLESNNEDGQDEKGEDDDEVVATDIPGGDLTASEANRRVHEFVQKPLTNLVASGELPLQPDLLQKLTPQQINIWIGKSTPQDLMALKIDKKRKDYGLGRHIFGGGISSGLHHDHADNLYIPICGSKRFTIFAPSDADKMYTVGDINKVYSSGVIDYKNNDNAPGWRSLRGDSAILTEVAKWKLDNDRDLTKEERDSLLDLIESEEELLEDFERKVIDSTGVKKDPPSFSRIPASVLHLDKITDAKLKQKLEEFVHDNWPKFLKAKRITVHLKPGQMMFLPAGWFHEVTSFGSAGKDNIHIALNYWYSPPNSDDKVYTDSYWPEDFSRTLESCKHFE